MPSESLLQPNQKSEIHGRTCIKCGQTKTLSEFYVKSHNKSGPVVDSKCKICHNKNMKHIAQLKKEAPPVPNVCDCCKISAIKYYLDHDHATGMFRGWLCNSCNIGIMNLGDNLSGIIKAVNYLSTNNGSKIKNSTGSN